MGTRGYITVKYNKKYYTRYNGMDSYPEGLGKKIVDHFKHLKSQYPDIDKEQYKEYILSAVNDNCTEISQEEPETTHMIEWVYIIDVEEMTLSVKGGYYEPVYNIYDLLPKHESDSDYNSDSDSEHMPYQPQWLKDFQKNNEKLAEEKKNEQKKIITLTRPHKLI